MSRPAFYISIIWTHLTVTCGQGAVITVIRAKMIMVDPCVVLYPHRIAASPVHTFYGDHEQLIMVFLLRETGTRET